MVQASIDDELTLIESSPSLHPLIPQYLLDYFKKDYNESVLKTLLNELDHLIESVDTNNSFRILSINDDTTLHNTTTTAANTSSLSSSQNNSSLILNNTCKTLLLDIVSRLLSIFQAYARQLTAHLTRFDAYTVKYNDNNGRKITFATASEILLYQRAILVDRLSARHYNLLNLMFKNVFDNYQRLEDEGEREEEDEDDEKRNEDENERDEALIEKFHQINKILFDLTLFDHLCGDVVVEVVENKIRQHIESTSLDNYQESFIEPFENWLEKIIIGWIKLIYSCSTQLDQQFTAYLLSYKKQLAHFMYTHYTHTRIKRLFDIVVDYPDSRPALDDLKLCLAKTQLRSHVVKSLKASIEQRLLHPGVNTSDIISAYVSAIKALLCLDPSGVMMENICHPLKKYLRSREDTVKCIVSNLTDDPESSNDLMEEFCKDLYSYEGNDVDAIDSATAQAPIGGVGGGVSGSGGGLSSRPNHKSWQLWQPDPVDSLTMSNGDLAGGNSGAGGSKSNIISMLVNIYGSKDMFVNEYKTLLSDRLLSNYAQSTTTTTTTGYSSMEKEIRNLELLKLRFGEASLFACEAMLKDIGESRRINANILEQLAKKEVRQIGTFEVSSQSLKALVISEQFWPKLKEEKIELPDELKGIQEKFVESFEAFKGNRTLIWKNNLGQVNLEIEVNRQKVSYSVNPIQAAIILKFQERDEWPLNDLAHSLKMCSFALRKKLFYWKSQGLIREKQPEQDQQQQPSTSSTDASQLPQPQQTQAENNEIYVLVKESSGKLGRSSRLVPELDDEEETDKNGSGGDRASRKLELLKDHELTLYWNYTQSMLRNVGCLPFERIHAWLKLYANAEITSDQTKYLCDCKVRDGLLKFNGGLYRLNK